MTQTPPLGSPKDSEHSLLKYMQIVVAELHIKW